MRFKLYLWMALLVIFTAVVLFAVYALSWSLNFVYYVFSGIVILAGIWLYGYAMRDSYRIRSLNDADQNPDADSRFTDLWRQYRESFVVGTDHTTTAADSWFNPDDMLAASQERIPVLAILKGMPGTFVGLGILGTFIGFSSGLSGFTEFDSASLMTSIETLLKGINTAFNTSIVGVILSIVFNFVFLQPLLKRLDLECRRLSERLDSRFYLDDIDHLREILVFQEDGVDYAPRDVNRQTLMELRNQTRSLANFTTDLSSSMQNLSESLVAAYSSEMQRMLQEEIRPVLDKLAGATEKLQKEKAESAGNALEGVMERLDRTLQEFMKSVSDSTKAEMEAVAERIKEASGALSGLPGILKRFEETIELAVRENVGTATKAFEGAATLQGEAATELRKLVDKVRESMESFTKTLESAESQNRRAEGLIAKFDDIADSTGMAIADLRASMDDTTKQKQELHQAMLDGAEALTSSVKATQEAAAGFGGLDQSIASTFQAMRKGIDEYREVVKASLEGNLGSYADSIKGFADRLASAAEDLGQKVDEVQETLEKQRK